MPPNSNRLNDPSSPEWYSLLRDARKGLHLSRRGLAAISGVSEHSIKAYEMARRSPSRSLLVALLNALGLDRIERTQILELAGFATDAEDLRPDRDDYWYTLTEATEAIQAKRWPAYVLGEMMEVFAANDLMLKVWGVSAREFDDEANRNIVASATDPKFAARIQNWDELVSVGLAVMKGHHRGAQASPEGSNPQVSTAMTRFMGGDPRLVAHAFELFEAVEPQYPKIRYSYNVVWDHPTVGILRFEALVTTANDLDGFTFQDYIPLDAETWQRLERLRDLPV